MKAVAVYTVCLSQMVIQRHRIKEKCESVSHRKMERERLRLREH
jgi:hypothetical protein